MLPEQERMRQLEKENAILRQERDILKKAVATRELVAFLADADSSIRWLAGSSLVQRANSDTVAAIAAFITGAEPERVTAAKPEIQRVLGLITETAENEKAQAAAQQALDSL